MSKVVKGCTAFGVICVLALLSLAMLSPAQDNPGTKTAAVEVFGYDAVSGDQIAHKVFDKPVPFVFTDSTVTIQMPDDVQIIQIVGQFEGTKKFKGIDPRNQHCVVFFMANDRGVFFVLQFKDVIIAYKMRLREDAPPDTNSKAD